MGACASFLFVCQLAPDHITTYQSWFIGKVPTPGGVPPTPSTSSAPPLSGGHSVSLDAEIANPNQVSPMSSAFPAQHRSGVM